MIKNSEGKLSITFSDDDKKTIENLANYLKKYRHHWKNVNFILYYSGEFPYKIII